MANDMVQNEVSRAIAEKTNEKIEQAIEDLRVKYDRIAVEEAERKAVREREEAAGGGGAASAGAGQRRGPREREDEDHSDDSDEDDEDDQFLNDPELDAIRAARLRQLKRSQAKKQEAKKLGHGEYREITEGEFLPEVTGSRLSLCVFFHRDFPRSEVMHQKMHRIAPYLPSTKFLCLNAEKAPFFVTKLAIRVMPSVLFFQDGVTNSRLLGFEGLIEDDAGEDFPTSNLVRLLLEHGVVDADEAEPLIDDLEEKEGPSLADEPTGEH